MFDSKICKVGLLYSIFLFVKGKEPCNCCVSYRFFFLGGFIAFISAMFLSAFVFPEKSQFVFGFIVGILIGAICGFISLTYGSILESKGK